MDLSIHQWRGVEPSQNPRGQVSNNREVGFASVLDRTRRNTKEERISRSVSEASQRYNLPPALILGVIKQESGFNPCAESPCGAQGLMQLMPETAKEVGVKDSLNIEQNIDGGSRYLRQMLDRFGGDVKLALAAYNSGPSRVEQCGGIPKIKETQEYVPAVLAHYEQFQVVPDFRIPEGMADAVVTVAIVSNPPSLRLPKTDTDDEPPPPPPNAVRV